MAINLAMVTFDCADPDALAAWWLDAVGGELNKVAPGEFVMVAGEGRRALGFQRVPDPTPGKNRFISICMPRTRRPRWRDWSRLAQPSWSATASVRNSN